MGSLGNSPRTVRGAIVAFDPTSPVSRVVVFQYNPDAVTRTLRPRTAPGDTQVGPADAHRLWGAPVETISMKLEVDAIDQLATGDVLLAARGIAPHLAALEMLLYPSSYQVIRDATLLAAGTIEILPAEAPLTVLAWGRGRVVPVRIESLTVNEEAFDPALHPVRATVELSAQVLTYNDLPLADAGYALFLRHQVLQEAMATDIGLRNAVAAVRGGVVR
jgi:hypothetical protein